MHTAGRIAEQRNGLDAINADIWVKRRLVGSYRETTKAGNGNKKKGVTHQNAA